MVGMMAKIRNNKYSALPAQISVFLHATGQCWLSRSPRLTNDPRQCQADTQFIYSRSHIFIILSACHLYSAFFLSFSLLYLFIPDRPEEMDRTVCAGVLPTFALAIAVINFSHSSLFLGTTVDAIDSLGKFGLTVSKSTMSRMWAANADSNKQLIETINQARVDRESLVNLPTIFTGATNKPTHLTINGM